jgi:hypothetical protein
VREGVAVDFSLHKPHRHGNARNFHAPVCATTREVGLTGLGAKASIEQSESDRRKRGLSAGKVELTAMRASWGELVNAHLLQHGIAARVSLRMREQGRLEAERPLERP